MSNKPYAKDEHTPVIALLRQPNSGKSTIFNMMTGFPSACWKLAG